MRNHAERHDADQATARRARHHHQDMRFEVGPDRFRGIESGVAVAFPHLCGAGLAAVVEEQRVDERSLVARERRSIHLQTQRHRSTAAAGHAHAALQLSFADHPRDEGDHFRRPDVFIPGSADDFRRILQNVRGDPRAVDGLGGHRHKAAV